MKIETDFVEDKTARTKAYYAKDESLGLSLTTIESLKQNVRLCLHRGAEDTFHQMLILEFRGKHFPAHRHPVKSEGYQIIEGEALLRLYDDQGNVTSMIPLNADNPIARVGPNAFHDLRAVTPYAIYLESKPGPFDRATDKVMAAWLKS